MSVKEQQFVARALRQFFLAYLRGGRKRVAMPSQVVDDLWHEFVLYTRNYERFCRKAFGGGDSTGGDSGPCSGGGGGD